MFSAIRSQINGGEQIRGRVRRHACALIGRTGWSAAQGEGGANRLGRRVGPRGKGANANWSPEIQAVGSEAGRWDLAPKGLMALGGANLSHGGEVTRGEAGMGSRGSGVAVVARIGEGDPMNSMAGFWP